MAWPRRSRHPACANVISGLSNDDSPGTERARLKFLFNPGVKLNQTASRLLAAPPFTVANPDCLLNGSATDFDDEGLPCLGLVPELKGHCPRELINPMARE